MMSKYLVQVLITLFLFAESSPTENIEITRSIGSSDSFHIPESVCEEEDGKRSHQFCTTICKEQDDDFSCSCPESNSTLIYRNNLWKCRGNIEVRTQLGCAKNSLFPNEDMKLPLGVLKTGSWQKTEVEKDQCYISPQASWYIGCDGEKKKWTANPPSIIVQWTKRPNIKKKACFVKVLDNSYQGQIVKLGITDESKSSTDRCLLFKVEGNLTCPILISPTDASPSRTVSTATSSTPGKEPQEIPLLTTESPIGVYLTTEIKSNTEARGRPKPSSGISQTVDDRNSSSISPVIDDGNSSSQTPVIAGVASSITVAIVVLIAVFFLCRRYRKRKEDHGSQKAKDGMMANYPSTTSDTGELYATLQTQEQHIYGHREVNEPNYCDPKGPMYDVSHYGSISVDQPVYNIVEDFTVKTTNRTEKGPNAMEPVYHELQDPCYDSSQSPELMGTNEAFYNSLEESHQSSGNEDNHKDEVVYNTLEEPHTPDLDTEDTCGSGVVHEAFYNVLEEP